MLLSLEIDDVRCKSLGGKDLLWCCKTEGEGEEDNGEFRAQLS